MADTVLTQTQIEDTFQSLTSTILNTTNPSAVRVEWPTDGAPSWSISEDVCFIAITPMDDPYAHPMQTDYSPNDDTTVNVSMTNTDVFRVTWAFYGPDCWDNARIVRSQLFSDTTRTTLQASNIALVTDVPLPVRSPELFNGQWWNRTTLYANFNELVIRTSTVPYLTSADVQVKEG